ALATAQSDHDREVSYYRQACEILEKQVDRIARNHPTIAAARRNLAMSFFNMAETQGEFQEDFEGLGGMLPFRRKETLLAVAAIFQLEALRSYQKALESSEKALQSSPDDNLLRYILAMSCYHVGAGKLQFQSAEEGFPLFERACSVLEQIIQA